jgi:hypothetical protein
VGRYQDLDALDVEECEMDLPVGRADETPVLVSQ